MSNEPASGYIKGPNGDDIRAYLKSLSKEDRSKLQRSAVYVERNFETEKINPFFEKMKKMHEELYQPGNSDTWSLYNENRSVFSNFLLEKITTDKKKRSFAVDEALLKDPEVAALLTRQNVNQIRNACIKLLENKDIWQEGDAAEFRFEDNEETELDFHVDFLGAYENVFSAMYSPHKSTNYAVGITEVEPTRLGGKKFVRIHSKDGEALAEQIEPDAGSLQLVSGKAVHARPVLSNDEISVYGTRDFVRATWNLHMAKRALIKAIGMGVDENFEKNLLECANKEIASIGFVAPKPTTIPPL